MVLRLYSRSHNGDVLLRPFSEDWEVRDWLADNYLDPICPGLHLLLRDDMNDSRAEWRRQEKSKPFRLTHRSDRYQGNLEGPASIKIVHVPTSV